MHSPIINRDNFKYILYIENMANDVEILARFDIDDSIIINKLTANKKLIQDLKEANKDYQVSYNKNVKEINKDISEQIKNQEKWAEEVRNGTLNQDVLNQLMLESNQVIQQNQARLNSLNEEFRENTRVIIENEESIKRLQSENRQLSSSYQAVLIAQSNLVDGYTSEGKSLAQLKDDNAQLKRLRDQIIIATDGESEEIAKLNALIDQNTQIIRNNGSEEEKRIAGIGEYKQAISSAFEELKSGNVQGAFDSIKESAKGLFQTLLANPFLAVIAGVLAAGKEIFDFNQGIQESNKLLKGLGVSGADLSTVRTEIKSTADTFNLSFEELAKTADSLAESYGISISQANDIITEGLAKGGAANEDFLNQISEYDVQFAKLGFSAKESLDVINQGFSEGVFADKLPDAIKELGLSLEEGTKGTRDALTNAFGKAFSDELVRDVQSGSITVKEALTKIGDESVKVGLNLQQQQQLTADAFRGAGEDAGGALKIIQLVTSTQKRELSEQEKATLNLVSANRELEQSIARAFEIKGFASSWDSFKAQAILTLSNIINYVLDLKEDLQPIIDIVGIVLANAWTTLKSTVGVVFDFIGGNIKLITNGLKTFVNVAKALLQGDFSGAISAIGDGFKNMLSIVDNTFARIKNTIVGGLQGIVSNVKPILSALGIDTENLINRLEKLKSKIPD
ncbi:MAG: hypothetical protein ACRCU6_05985, partial [Fusobacteriaceae bacterium]